MRETIHVNVRAPQYVVDTNVTFAQVPDWFGHTTKDLKMDIIYPEQKDKKSPCIVWICGGAWKLMERSAHLAYLSELARSGFAVASVQYRTSNEVEFPGQLEDVKAGIRYLKAHADRYCIDIDRFGVMGESAGGHLAALAGLTGDDKKYDRGDYLEHSSAVQAVCPWYPPADIRLISKEDQTKMALTPEAMLVGGSGTPDFEQKIWDACPVKYVTKLAPPFLILHGLCDHTVPFSQGESLHDELEKQGADVRLVAIEDADHADLHFFQQEVWDIIIDFFKDKIGR